MIQASNLSYYIGDRCLFKNLSFVMPDFGLVQICGDNGRGKTTFLMVLSFLEKPTTGTLFYDDVKMEFGSFEAKKKREKDAIYLLPNGNFDDSLTIEENLKQFDVAEASFCPFPDRFPSSLSGGEKEICLAYLVEHTRKKIIFKDEGFGFLDKERRDESFASLLRAKTNHLIVIASPRRLDIPSDLIINISGESDELD